MLPGRPHQSEGSISKLSAFILTVRPLPLFCICVCAERACGASAQRYVCAERQQCPLAHLPLRGKIWVFRGGESFGRSSPHQEAVRGLERSNLSSITRSSSAKFAHLSKNFRLSNWGIWLYNCKKKKTAYRDCNMVESNIIIKDLDCWMSGHISVPDFW